MKVAILGGSGFIGTHLTEHLLAAGHQVQIWTRAPEEYDLDYDVELQKWPLDESRKHLDIDAIVNLAGETINQRWTAEAKERILHSRVDTTYHVVQLIKKGFLAPKIIVNGSAVGYYGTSKNKKFKENDPPQNDFLSQVAAAWEKVAEQFKSLNQPIRLVKLRFGLVLGDGGALPKMALPYKMFAGGRVGSGKQWVSWIHVHDISRMITFALEQEQVEGVYNAVAPHPVMMNELGKTIGQALNRPHWLPAPSFAFQLALGEMSDLLLKGQHVLADKIQHEGFTFAYPKLLPALKQSLQKKSTQEVDDK
ncbi:TIGR01777 family oxidoreductase [Bacillus horti]|uniref:Uncharacterized protein (TIGR01777 family) n=1 Tax=Caldalkalibacillus horti TaxID=77523 RepID=A0ABT9W1S1_9BACI|nr:TIGR01777 family oxidoreductase [Bacillus horti]MDQ0167060.1 uncharacterized protein (TIGR01777 family) [Bacillus horti]